MASLDLTLFSLSVSVSVSVRYDDRLPQVPCVAACSESMGLKISGKVRLGEAHLASCPSGTRIPNRYTVSRKSECTPRISAKSSPQLEDDGHAANLMQCAAHWPEHSHTDLSPPRDLHRCLLHSSYVYFWKSASKCDAGHAHSTSLAGPALRGKPYPIESLYALGHCAPCSSVSGRWHVLIASAIVCAEQQFFFLILGELFATLDLQWPVWGLGLVWEWQHEN